MDMSRRALKGSKKVALVLVAASGVAVACNTTPRLLPPNPIDVGWLDAVVALFGGYTNPLQAAMLDGLDDAGEMLYGAAAWKADSFAGYVTYTSPNIFGHEGKNILYMEKPCGEKAIDKAEVADISGGGGGGDGGGGEYTPNPGDVIGGSGYIYMPGGCVSVGGGEYHCDAPYYIPAT